MSKTNNEVMVNTATGEVLNGVELVQSRIVSETDEYRVIQNPDGTFKRQAKYKEFSSVTTATRAEKIELHNLLEGAEGSGFGMKDHVGKTIEVANIITRPYDKINEENGEFEYGVLTYLLTPSNEAYVTSAKSVYFSIVNAMKVFGEPTDTEWENLQILIGKEKMANGDAIKIKVVG